MDLESFRHGTSTAVINLVQLIAVLVHHTERPSLFTTRRAARTARCGDPSMVAETCLGPYFDRTGLAVSPSLLTLTLTVTLFFDI